jgi:hypothetical protein
MRIFIQHTKDEASIVRSVSSALQIALFGAGFKVGYEDAAHGLTYMKEGGNPALLLATTFDNLAAMNVAKVGFCEGTEVIVCVEQEKP